MGRMKETIQDDLFIPAPPERSFDGATYDADADFDRLGAQCRRVFELMKDGRWRTLDEIGDITGYQPQSVSARLRDFRKPRFGEHAVERRSRGVRQRGLFEYRLVVNQQQDKDKFIK